MTPVEWSMGDDGKAHPASAEAFAAMVEHMRTAFAGFHGLAASMAESLTAAIDAAFPPPTLVVHGRFGSFSAPITLISPAALPAEQQRPSKDDATVLFERHGHDADHLLPVFTVEP